MPNFFKKFVFPKEAQPGYFLRAANSTPLASQYEQNQTVILVILHWPDPWLKKDLDRAIFVLLITFESAVNVMLHWLLLDELEAAFQQSAERARATGAS